jgi:hypothetical protein
VVLSFFSVGCVFFFSLSRLSLSCRGAVFFCFVVTPRPFGLVFSCRHGRSARLLGSVALSLRTEKGKARARGACLKIEIYEEQRKRGRGGGVYVYFRSKKKCGR